MWDERNSFTNNVQTAVEQPRYIREPNMMPGHYGGKKFAPQVVINIPEDADTETEPVSTPKHTKPNNTKANNSKNNKPKSGGKPKHLTPETGKEKQSIWESQKSVRKPRR